MENPRGTQRQKCRGVTISFKNDVLILNGVINRIEKEISLSLSLSLPLSVSFPL
jgi:hypothetical protein